MKFFFDGEKVDRGYWFRCVNRVLRSNVDFLANHPGGMVSTMYITPGYTREGEPCFIFFSHWLNADIFSEQPLEYDIVKVDQKWELDIQDRVFGFLC